MAETVDISRVNLQHPGTFGAGSSAFIHTAPQGGPSSRSPPQREQQSGPAEGARPYRSHKIRACDLCRRRKVRCLVETPGQPCALCKTHNAHCHHGSVKDISRSRGASGSTNANVQVQPDVSGQEGSVERAETQRRFDSVYTGSASRCSDASLSARITSFPTQQTCSIDVTSHSRHIVGPAAAEDVQILEEFMSPDHTHTTSQAKYGSYSSDPTRPVLYTVVPRRREGFPTSESPGSKERAIIEQIMMPMMGELIKCYFEHFNPCFPIIDMRLATIDYPGLILKASSTVVCQMAAVALTYWIDEGVKRTPCADHGFIWNLAVKALRDDFMAPGLTTLQAVLLDLTGRPIYSMMGNGINCGRALSLSYSLGLNRDPSTWNIAEEEKDLRVRLWWALLVHDRWSSFAHGTPPLVVRGHYDVPLPRWTASRSSAMTMSDDYHRFECFLAMCTLTIVLGDLLPLVYDLQTASNGDMIKKIRRLRADMDVWEDSLPSHLCMDNRQGPATSGLSSLKLSFLAVKMLTCRIELHAVTHSAELNTMEARQYHQAECRRSAKAIVAFVACLSTANLNEFWLPYSAYHLNSTATLLLRCALETTDDRIAEECIFDAKTLVTRLRRAKEEDDWDLADFCLSQCEDVLYRMATNNDQGGVSIDQPAQSSSQTVPVNGLSYTILNPGAPESYQHGTDLVFHDLWDMFRFEESDFS